MRSTSELVGFSVSVTVRQRHRPRGREHVRVEGCRGVVQQVPAAWCQSCLPAAGLADYGDIIQSFDCIVEYPYNPPTLPAGTYRIGTVVWDTSGMALGPIWIAAYIDEPGRCVQGGDQRQRRRHQQRGGAELRELPRPDPDPTPVPSIPVQGYAVLFSGVMGVGLLLGARACVGRPGARPETVPTRLCWSKGNGGCDDFMKLRFVVQRVRIPPGQG